MLPQIYLKQSTLSSISETEMLHLFPTEVILLFFPVQPIWIHPSARCLSFIPLSVIFRMRGAEIWIYLSPFLSLLYSTFKFCPVEKLCRKGILFQLPLTISKLEQHSREWFRAWIVKSDIGLNPCLRLTSCRSWASNMIAGSLNLLHVNWRLKKLVRIQ